MSEARPSERFDVAVIGGGANGLAAAAVLGRAGKRVVVLEARAELGGLAASIEFHPGYRSAGVLADTSLVRPALVAELELARYGLELRTAPLEPVALGRGGRLDLAAPPAALQESIAGLRAFASRLRPVLAAFSDQPPLDVLDLAAESSLELLRRGLKLRALGRRDMLELMRVAPMCVGDWLREHLGTGSLADLAAAALALPALTATFSAPRSPGGCANLLLLEAMRGAGTAGGSHRFIAALERAARDVRVEIRTESAVAKILVEGRRACGVALADGETVAADLVVSSADPRNTLLEMVHPAQISVVLAERLRNYRCRGTTAHLLVALSADVDLPARSIIAEGLDEIERAFDPIKYGELPARPVIELTVASALDASLCPPGHAVLSALVHFVPTEMRGGYTDAHREAITKAALARLATHVPGLADRIVATSLQTPTDIARDYRLTGGNLHHGERAIDQLLVRPVPECSQYATPIRGLYLCGGGTHPGGGLHGGNGRLAARAILAAKTGA